MRTHRLGLPFPLLIPQTSGDAQPLFRSILTRRILLRTGECSCALVMAKMEITVASTSKKNRNMQIHPVNETPMQATHQWQQPAPELWVRLADLEGQISRQAYQHFVARGREGGHDVDDWLQAEIEVLGRSAKTSSE